MKNWLYGLFYLGLFSLGVCVGCITGIKSHEAPFNYGDLLPNVYALSGFVALISMLICFSLSWMLYFKNKKSEVK